MLYVILGRDAPVARERSPSVRPAHSRAAFGKGSDLSLQNLVRPLFCLRSNIVVPGMSRARSIPRFCKRQPDISSAHRNCADLAANGGKPAKGPMRTIHQVCTREKDPSCGQSSSRAMGVLHKIARLILGSLAKDALRKMPIEDVTARRTPTRWAQPVLPLPPRDHFWFVCTINSQHGGRRAGASSMVARRCRSRGAASCFEFTGLVKRSGT